jgi:hypothetical protein
MNGFRATGTANSGSSYTPTGAVVFWGRYQISFRSSRHLRYARGPPTTVVDQPDELGRGNHLAAWRPDLPRTEIRAAWSLPEEAS